MESPVKGQKKGPLHGRQSPSDVRQLQSTEVQQEEYHEIKHRTSRSKLHQVKGKIKEVAGKLSDTPDWKLKATDEKIAGKVRTKSSGQEILGK